ncbi:MAG TPA: hypothetical protein VH370_07460 [Humisphaera sp.]|nr:hypothetical protein [Humisphaera sp.]
MFAKRSRWAGWVLLLGFCATPWLVGCDYDDHDHDHHAWHDHDRGDWHDHHDYDHDHW